MSPLESASESHIKSRGTNKPRDIWRRRVYRISRLVVIALSVASTFVVLTNVAYGFARPILSVESATAARQSSDQVEFVEGLRRRQLYRLAIQHCNQELARQEIGELARVDLTIELMKTYVAQAAQETGEARSRSYQTAHQVADRFVTDYADAPRAILVKVQDALIYLTAGRLLRLEAEIGIGDEATSAAAESQLKESTRLLDELDEELEQLIPQRFQQSADSDELSGEQLLGLRQRVRFQRTQAEYQRGMLFATDSRNRTSVLSQVLEQLTELQRSVPQDNTLWWDIQFQELDCLFDLDLADQAATTLAALPKELPNNQIATEVLIRQARLKLARGDAVESFRELWTWRQTHQTRQVSLDQVALDAMLELSRSEELSDQQRRQWQQQAVTLAKQIEEDYGIYWGRRANLKLVGAAGAESQLQSAAILMQVANEHYLKGKLPEALQAYQKAAETAEQDQQLEMAFAAGRKAGLVAQSLKQYEIARTWLRDVALAQPTLAESAPTHLQAIWNQAQIASQSKEAVDTYRQLLEEHLVNWPASPVDAQARGWLGKLLIFEREPLAAIEILLAHQLAVSDSPELVDAAATAAEQMITSETDPARQSALAYSLAEKFQSLVPSSATDGSVPWSEMATQAALASTRLLVVYSDEPGSTTLKTIDQLLAAGQPQEGSWRNQAMSLKLIYVARRPSGTDEVDAIVAELCEGEPRELLDVVEVMQRLIDETTVKDRREGLARINLQLIASLLQQTQQLEKAQVDRSRQLKANSLFALSRYAEASDEYRRLWEEEPRNAARLQQLAQSLTNQEGADALHEGLGRWRHLAQGSRPQSELWFRAKYEVANTLIKQGENEEAKKFLKYLQAIPPGWKESKLSDAFDTLLRSVE